MRIAFLDPGLDVTGFSVLEYDGSGANLNRAIHHLVDAGDIRSSSKDPLYVRLQTLGETLDRLLEGHGVFATFVEKPAYAGNYRGTGKSRQKTMQAMLLATGALWLAAAAHGGVWWVDATRTSKDHDHFLLLELAKTEGVHLPEGPRGGKREDAWDAIWLGLRWLQDPPERFRRNV